MKILQNRYLLIIIVMSYIVLQGCTTPGPSLEPAAAPRLKEPVNFELSPLFKDNMVLQRNQKVSIYGTATAGTEITVTFNSQKKRTKANSSGNWELKLNPMKRSFAPKKLVVTAKKSSEQVVIDNVLIGDVWLCSGQSNMERWFGSYPLLKGRTKKINNPDVRSIVMAKRSFAEPDEQIVPKKPFVDAWRPAREPWMMPLSPTAYYFAAKLRNELDVPIGLIVSAIGGTQIQRWMPREVVEGLDLDSESSDGAGVLYNTMIHPLRNFTIKGVIWYQGESNGRIPHSYYALTQTHIKTWRQIWAKNNPHLKDMPFFTVQLAPFQNRVDGLAGDAWAYIRDAQLKTLSLPNTGLAVTTDVGEYADIHPQDKQPVGERLALWAEKLENRSIVHSGPLFKKAIFKGSKVEVYFSETGSGLQTRRVAMSSKKNVWAREDPDAYVVPADKLAGFVVCGADKKFLPAEAKIVGDHVEVYSKDVSKPIAVRYGWSTFPLCNLYNKEGLPASPFRSDNWSVPDVQNRTIGKKLKGDEKKLGFTMQFAGSTTETEWEKVTKANKQGFQVTPGQGPKPNYAYFKVTDNSLKSGKCPKVIVTIVYFDQGEGTVLLQYDSTDKNVREVKDAPGAWKIGGKIKLQNTLTWKKAAFVLTDAFFDGRCNGADIRLNCARSFVFSKLYCRKKVLKRKGLTVGEAAFQEILGRQCPVVRLWPDATGPDAKARGNVGDEQYTQGAEIRKKDPTRHPSLKITKVSEPSFTVISPEKNANGTAIIFCPGGAYGTLASHWTLDCARFFNDLGITVVWLKYRVPRLRDDAFMRGHHAISDGQRAVSLLRSRAAEWSIDPKKIGVHGSSAGGHLCAYLSLNHNKRLYQPVDEHDKVSCRPDFVILNFPAYLRQDNKSKSLRLDPVLHPENIKQGIVPPTIINLCMDDGVAVGSVTFYDSLLRNNVPAELHVYPRGGHSGALHKYPFNEWATHTVRFMRDHGFLKSQDRKPTEFRIDRTDEIPARDGELPCDRIIRQMLGGKSESYAIWPEGKIPKDTGTPEQESYTYNNNYRLTDVATPTITVMRPKVNKTKRAVIVCPGGGYNKLAVEHEGVEIGRWLNSQGITAVILKYRVPRRKDVPKHHVAFQDIQRAIRFVRSKADALQIDPGKIGTIGFSAGGHLCASLSVNHMVRSYDPVDEVDRLDAKPNFTILVYPAYLASGNNDGKLDPFFVQPFSKDNTADTFICIAADDKHKTGIIDYYLHLRKANIPTELHFFHKGGHGGGLREKHPFPEWTMSCRRWLKDLEPPKPPKPQAKKMAIPPGRPGETKQQRNRRMAWWRQARFGMFIHWGVYAVPAGVYKGKNISGIGEWILDRADIPVPEYKTYASRFNPVKYDPDAWVRLAKEAGMKYIVITSKHHDGFALFDSKVTDWDVVDATPYGKDLLKPLARACKKHNMKLGFYYSQAQDWCHKGGARRCKIEGIDWTPLEDAPFDNYLNTIAVPQVREILSNYGPVSVLWWDTPAKMTDKRGRMFSFVPDLQPHIIENNRRQSPNIHADFTTPEQKIPDTGLQYDWETCMTMNGTWGFKSTDHNWKSTKTLLQNLIDIASKGGNYLLNVGPTAEGEIPQPSIKCLKEMGTWMKTNGQSIYGTTASPFAAPKWGRYTKKAGMLYAHVFDWPDSAALSAEVGNNEVKKIYLLQTKEELKWKKAGAYLQVRLPKTPPDPIASVIVIELKEI